MSDEEKLTMGEYLHVVRRHLSRYCISLSYIPSGEPNPKKWKYGTGFLLTLKDTSVIVTVRHLATKVLEFKKNDKSARFLVNYTHASGELKTRSYSPEELTDGSFAIAPDCDAALFRLSPEFAPEIAEQGNHFFTMGDFLRGRTTERHLTMVSGYPCQGNFYSENEAFISKAQGQWRQHMQVKLGSLAFQTTLVARRGEQDAALPTGFDCEVDEHAFRPFLGHINSNPASGITTAVGMSGGPVIAIAMNAENAETFFQPRIIGMQASQKLMERQEQTEVTELTAVSSAKLHKWIESTAF